MRTEKISADISQEGKMKLIELCDKFERSRGYMLERMINKFYEQTFVQQKETAVAVVEKPKAKRAVFTPPEVGEVYRYMIERGMTQQHAQNESEKFIDHHTMKGWLVGNSKTKMKDWKAGVRTWMRGKTYEAGKQANSKYSDGLSDSMRAIQEARAKRDSTQYGFGSSMGNNDGVLFEQVDTEEWSNSQPIMDGRIIDAN